MRFAGVLGLGAMVCLVPATGSVAQTTKLQLSHVNPPTHSSHTVALKFAEVANKLSDGRLNVTVVPAGQLGGMKATLDSARLGAAIISYTPPSVAQDYSAKVSIFSAAYMFDSLEHAERFRAGPGGDLIWKEIEAAGLKHIFDWYFGSRQLWVRKCGTKPESFGGMKMRVPPARIFAFNARANGLSPTPIDFPETYGALQAGVVDAVDVSPASFLASKFAETGLKCVLMTSHDYQLNSGFMNKKLFDGLGPKSQKALLDAGKEAAALNKQITQKEETDTMKVLAAKHGVKVIGKAEGLDIEAFRKNARDIVRPEFKSVWGQEIIDLVGKAR